VITSQLGGLMEQIFFEVKNIIKELVDVLYFIQITIAIGFLSVHLRKW
jgi:hypothetical protein